MKTRPEYPALFAPQVDGGYTVTFPDFPEAVAEGDTVEEASKHAAEALTLSIEGRLAEKQQIPEPSLITNARYLAPV